MVTVYVGLNTILQPGIERLQALADTALGAMLS